MLLYCSSVASKPMLLLYCAKTAQPTKMIIWPAASFIHPVILMSVTRNGM